MYGLDRYMFEFDMIVVFIFIELLSRHTGTYHISFTILQNAVSNVIPIEVNWPNLTFTDHESWLETVEQGLIMWVRKLMRRGMGIKVFCKSLFFKGF
jgi:hypothetical protein